MDETEKLGRNWVGLAERKMGASQESICLFPGFCLLVCLFLSRKKNVGRDPILTIFSFSSLFSTALPRPRIISLHIKMNLEFTLFLHVIPVKHTENNRKQCNKHSHTYHPAFK